MSQEHFECSKEMLQQIAQTMLEVKKMARSMENAADALLPMAESDAVKANLELIVAAGQSGSAHANQIYHLIAREANKP